LWNVDSAVAAELMSHFYVSLKSGAGAAEALRAARQAVRRGGRW
jgi:CHAT domain-containing protein